MNNPISWMPKPGHFVRIPGGAIWCERWEVTEGFRGYEGTITMRFQCERAEYDAAMAEPAALPPPPLALPEG